MPETAMISGDGNQSIGGKGRVGILPSGAGMVAIPPILFDGRGVPIDRGTASSHCGRGSGENHGYLPGNFGSSAPGKTSCCYVRPGVEIDQSINGAMEQCPRDSDVDGG